MDLRYINSRICDRNNCFYWQTDRNISAEEAALIWKDRHSSITNEELFDKINTQLDERFTKVIANRRKVGNQILYNYNLKVKHFPYLYQDIVQQILYLFQ